MKRTIASIFILTLFFIVALGSGSSYSTIDEGRSYGSDAYSTPSRPYSGTCAACGGKGYITRNGNRETCVCGGTGKSVPFPN